MRVAIVNQSAERLSYFAQAFHALVALDVRLLAISVEGDGVLLDAARELGCSAVVLGARSVAGYPSATLRLARSLREWEPDIVHTVGPIPTTIGGLGSKLARRGVVVYHRHHLTAEEPSPFPWLANRLSHTVMAVSEATRQAALEEHVRGRVVVVRNGVNPPRDVSDVERNKTRQRVGATPTDVVLVLVAHLRRGKGHEVMTRSLGEIERRIGRRVIAVFVGDGPERDRIEHLAAAADGGAVVLVGHQEDVWPWYAAADVAVLPSEEESFGLVVAEAMAAGTPVVASDVGGLREVVEDGYSGRLVKVGDEAALAVAVSDLLIDKRGADRIAANARRSYQERFTIRAMVAGWVACYKATAPRAS